jgi:hypothetical protein
LDWRPIDTLKLEDGLRVMLACDGFVGCGKWVDDSFMKEEFVGETDSGDRIYRTVKAERGYWVTDSELILPTHWMPLPAPPVTPSGSSRATSPESADSLR